MQFSRVWQTWIGCLKDTLGSVPSIRVTVHNCSQLQSQEIPFSLLTSRCTYGTMTYMQAKHIYKIKNIKVINDAPSHQCFVCHWNRLSASTPALHIVLNTVSDWFKTCHTPVLSALWRSRQGSQKLKVILQYLEASGATHDLVSKNKTTPTPPQPKQNQHGSVLCSDPGGFLF